MIQKEYVNKCNCEDRKRWRGTERRAGKRSPSWPLLVSILFVFSLFPPLPPSSSSGVGARRESSITTSTTTTKLILARSCQQCDMTTTT